MGILEELKEFKKFKENYQFEQKEINEIAGKQYCEGISLINDEGEIIGECEKWINVRYTHKDSFAKVII